MPERNGIEATIWIRNFEKEKKCKVLPIIGLTGHEDPQIKKSCIEAGMNKVLSKPIKMTDVLDILKIYTGI